MSHRLIANLYEGVAGPVNLFIFTVFLDLIVDGPPQGATTTQHARGGGDGSACQLRVLETAPKNTKTTGLPALGPKSFAHITASGSGHSGSEGANAVDHGRSAKLTGWHKAAVGQREHG